MTPRRPAYAEALQRAAGLADVPAGFGHPAAVTAEPRPRSRFEDSWKDGGPDATPFGEQDVEALAPDVRSPWPDLAAPPGPPAEAVAAGPVPPGPGQPGNGAHHDALRLADDGGPPRDAPTLQAVPTGPRTPEPANAPLPVTAALAPPGVEAASAVPSPYDVPPAPWAHDLDDVLPRVPVVAQPMPRDADDDPGPAAPLHPAAEADDAPPGVEVVRAVPLPADPFPGPPLPAPAPADPPAPIVVEIGRVEVRLAADPPPTAVPRERRPRTEPTLEEYLGVAPSDGTGRWRP